MEWRGLRSRSSRSVGRVCESPGGVQVSRAAQERLQRAAGGRRPAAGCTDGERGEGWSEAGVGGEIFRVLELARGKDEEWGIRTRNVHEVEEIVQLHVFTSECYSSLT